MTGLLTFPNISCVSTNLQNIHQPTLSPEAAWKTLIQQCHFDEKKKKDIRALFHFTHLSNLESIHQHGLLTRTHLNNNKMPYTYNDEIRLDSVPNSISLSIGFPNYRMFYHYWNKSKNHKNDWIILKINPNLLTGEIANLDDFDYLNKAIFCSSNAANKLIKHIPIENRKTYNAFLSMFERDTECNTSHPCDEQAEILYQGNIPIECIECIYVFSVKMKTYCQTKTSIPVYIDTRLFTYRNTRVMYG
ncbi:MAG: DUF4433 domain-containing protein [Moraxellaceae bacterium]|nr:DUF4433 domain-containing protein [Moraxellaceae bacterium]